MNWSFVFFLFTLLSAQKVLSLDRFVTAQDLVNADQKTRLKLMKEAQRVQAIYNKLESKKLLKYKTKYKHNKKKTVQYPLHIKIRWGVVAAYAQSSDRPNFARGKQLLAQLKNNPGQLCMTDGGIISKIQDGKCLDISAIQNLTSGDPIKNLLALAKDDHHENHRENDGVCNPFLYGINLEKSNTESCSDADTDSADTSGLTGLFKKLTTSTDQLEKDYYREGINLTLKIVQKNCLCFSFTPEGNIQRSRNIQFNKKHEYTCTNFMQTAQYLLDDLINDCSSVGFEFNLNQMSTMQDLLEKYSLENTPINNNQLYKVTNKRDIPSDIIQFCGVQNNPALAQNGGELSPGENLDNKCLHLKPTQDPNGDGVIITKDSNEDEVGYYEEWIALWKVYKECLVTNIKSHNRFLTVMTADLRRAAEDLHPDQQKYLEFILGDRLFGDTMLMFSKVPQDPQTIVNSAVTKFNQVPEVATRLHNYLNLRKYMGKREYKHPPQDLSYERVKEYYEKDGKYYEMGIYIQGNKGKFNEIFHRLGAITKSQEWDAEAKENKDKYSTLNSPAIKAYFEKFHDEDTSTPSIRQSVFNDINAIKNFNLSPDNTQVPFDPEDLKNLLQKHKNPTNSNGAAYKIYQKLIAQVCDHSKFNVTGNCKEQSQKRVQKIAGFMVQKILEEKLKEKMREHKQYLEKPSNMQIAQEYAGTSDAVFARSRMFKREPFNHAEYGQNIANLRRKIVSVFNEEKRAELENRLAPEYKISDTEKSTVKLDPDVVTFLAQTVDWQDMRESKRNYKRYKREAKRALFGNRWRRFWAKRRQKRAARAERRKAREEYRALRNANRNVNKRKEKSKKKSKENDEDTDRPPIHYPVGYDDRQELIDDFRRYRTILDNSEYLRDNKDDLTEHQQNELNTQIAALKAEVDRLIAEDKDGILYDVRRDEFGDDIEDTPIPSNAPANLDQTIPVGSTDIDQALQGPPASDATITLEAEDQGSPPGTTAGAVNDGVPPGNSPPNELPEEGQPTTTPVNTGPADAVVTGTSDGVPAGKTAEVVASSEVPTECQDGANNVYPNINQNTEGTQVILTPTVLKCVDGSSTDVPTNTSITWFKRDLNDENGEFEETSSKLDTPLTIDTPADSDTNVLLYFKIDDGGTSYFSPVIEVKKYNKTQDAEILTELLCQGNETKAVFKKVVNSVFRGSEEIPMIDIEPVIYKCIKKDLAGTNPAVKNIEQWELAPVPLKKPINWEITQQKVEEDVLNGETVNSLGEARTFNANTSGNDPYTDQLAPNSFYRFKYTVPTETFESPFNESFESENELKIYTDANGKIISEEDFYTNNDLNIATVSPTAPGDAPDDTTGDPEEVEEPDASANEEQLANHNNLKDKTCTESKITLSTADIDPENSETAKIEVLVLPQCKTEANGTVTVDPIEAENLSITYSHDVAEDDKEGKEFPTELTSTITKLANKETLEKSFPRLSKSYTVTITLKQNGVEDTTNSVVVSAKEKEKKKWGPFQPIIDGANRLFEDIFKSPGAGAD